jgi:hypothetical protein
LGPSPGRRPGRLPFPSSPRAEAWQRAATDPRAASAVEREPAQRVAQPLVVEHEFPDLLRELGALPPALQSAGFRAVICPRCRPNRPGRIRSGAQFVRRHVADGRRLAGGVCGMPCCSTQISGRRVGMAGRRASLGPPDLAPRPGPPKLDRAPRTVVLGSGLLEVVEYVLRTVGRPDRESVVIVVLERPSATDGDQARIPDLGKDHGGRSAQRPKSSRTRWVIGSP